LFDNIASIDIGTSSIKLLKVRRGFKKFELLSAIIEDIDQETHNNDYALAVENALHRILEKENLSGYKIVTSMPSDSLLLRNITFPFNDINKISSAIPYEVEEIIPCPVDAVSYDFQIVGQENTDNSTVILAAIEKESLKNTIDILNRNALYPVFAGMESNSMFRCYEYFNSVNNETVLQIDFGYKKTVINIVSNNSLIFTRAIASGTVNLIEKISGIQKISVNEAQKLFLKLDIDLSSFESNLKNETHKTLNINRAKFKTIYNEALDLVMDIINEISFTIKASGRYTGYSNFSRIIITGGGSNIKGITKLLGDDSGLPVVYMPFLNGYNDVNIKSRFSICLGNLLVYMNNSSASVNFLKGEFTPDVTSGILQTYYLPVFFISLTLFILVINILSSVFFIIKSNSYTNNILQQKFKKYFNMQNTTNDPLKEAMNLLAKEKKEFSVLKDMLGDENRFMPLLSLIIKNFNSAEGFDIKKLTFDGKSISIDAEIKSSGDLDEFKKSLLNSGEFENVTANIKDTSKSRSLFTLTIKQKL
jgi:type IV pilus assembly protein PilM